MKIHQFWYSLDEIPDGKNAAYEHTFNMMNSWRRLGLDYKVYDNDSARKYLADNMPSGEHYVRGKCGVVYCPDYI